MQAHTAVTLVVRAWFHPLPMCTPTTTQRQTLLILNISAGAGLRLLGIDWDDLSFDQ